MSFEKAVSDLKKAIEKTKLQKEFLEDLSQRAYHNVSYNTFKGDVVAYAKPSSPKPEEKMYYDDPTPSKKKKETISIKQVLFADSNKSASRIKIWKPSVRLPQLEELIEAFGKEDNICIAGGAVLGSYLAVSYGDIDVFPFNGRKNIERAYKIIEGLGYEPSSEVEHCRNYKHRSGVYRDLQIISVNVEAESPLQIITDFDLSVCQVAVHRGKLVTTKLAFDDIKLRLLRCVGSANLGDTFRRVEKYRKRGFKVLGLEAGQSLIDYLQAAEKDD